jgi:hypothetical protein
VPPLFSLRIIDFSPFPPPYVYLYFMFNCFPVLCIIFCRNLISFLLCFRFPFSPPDTKRQRHLRKALTPCFSHAALRRVYPRARARCVALCDHLQQRGSEEHLGTSSKNNSTRDQSGAKGGSVGGGGGGAVSFEAFSTLSRLTCDTLIATSFDREIGLIEGGRDHVSQDRGKMQKL